jgi:hypothetical protein
MGEAVKNVIIVAKGIPMDRKTVKIGIIAYEPRGDRAPTKAATTRAVRLSDLRIILLILPVVKKTLKAAPMTIPIARKYHRLRNIE